MGFKSVSKEDASMYFSTVFSSPLMGIAVTDASGGVHEANEAFLEMLGYTREDLESGSMNWQKFTAPESLERSQEALAELLESGTTRPFEKVYLHTSGERITTMSVSQKIKEIDGRFISCVLNISESKKMKENINQAMKVATLGQFTTEIIHDFNNIVGVVQLSVDMIENKQAANLPIAKEINLIRRATDRAAGLAKHLLAFCRADSDDSSDWNPGEATREIAEILQQLLGKKCQLEMHLQADVASVTGSKMQFEQILMNLTVNARDAMPIGGVILVEIENQNLNNSFEDVCGNTFLPGDYIKIRVKDTGTGIDEVNKKRIFDPFFTTKPKGVGTGLGLGTVMSAVKKMGGGLTMTSEVGVGTDFQIFIPIKKENLVLEIA